MQTLQKAKDLSKYKRKQAFIMVEDSMRCGFDKGTVGTLEVSFSSPKGNTVTMEPLSSKRVTPRAMGVNMTGSKLYEDVKSVKPFTIGMSVKPQEGWKVLKP